MTGRGFHWFGTGLLALLFGPCPPAFPQVHVPLAVPELNGAHVQCFAEDPNGALWIGTDRGILRFDGTSVEHYVSDPTDLDALPQDVVFSLLVDHNGLLWAATAGGVWSVNTVTGVHGRVRFARNGGVADLECLQLAPSREGQWAFCGGAGIFKLAKGDSLYRPVPMPLPVRRASGGWEAPDGSLWFVDRMALCHWSPNTDKMDVFPLDPFGEKAPPKTLLLDVMPDRNEPSRLWVRSWGIGFISFDLRTHKFDPIAHVKPLSDLENVVAAAAQVAPDLWYLAMDGKLWTLRTSGHAGALTPVQPGMEAFGLGAARDGSTFIGGNGEVDIIPGPVASGKRLGGALAHADLHAIGDRKGDGYWAVRYYADRALLRIDPQGVPVLSIPLPMEDHLYEPFLLVDGADGNVWIGTTRGLFRHTPGTKTIERIPLILPDTDATFANILDLEEDDGAIWAALGNGSVLRLDEGTGAISAARIDPALGDALPIAITRLDHHHMLVTRQNASPIIVDRKDLLATRFAGPEFPDAGFTEVMGAVVQNDGRVILYARSHGLVRFQRQDDGSWGRDHHWYLPMRPSFTDAVCDRIGRIFFTTDRGAFMLDPGTDVLYPLDALHGVDAVLDAYAEILPDGNVLLGGTPHFLFTTDFRPALTRTPLLVRSFSAAGSELLPALMDVLPLELTHAQNNIAISFGRIAILDGDMFTYAYRTVRDGKEEPWNELGRQRNVNLIGLGPGEYRIDVRSDGLTAAPAYASVSFTLLPAWWDTWWMRTLALLAMVALVVAATRQVIALRYRQRLKAVERQGELERVRLRIARDVHDGIGSGLTKITMMSRQLEDSAGPQAAHIAKAASDLVNELGEIVWTVDPRNDSYSSFVAYVRNMLGRWSEEIAVPLSADLRFDPADGECIIGPEVKRNVLLVLKEAVNNALKHSGAERIQVEMELTQDRVHLEVCDNGNGFDQENIREGGNGLVNFGKRAELIHGTYELQSGPTGTRVVLDAPMISTNM